MKVLAIHKEMETASTSTKEGLLCIIGWVSISVAVVRAKGQSPASSDSIHEVKQLPHLQLEISLRSSKNRLPSILSLDRIAWRSLTH